MIISACPERWEWKPEFSKCYYYIYEPKTWYEANDACMALDPDGQATLASVKSQEESDYIQSLPLPWGYFAWIGGTDEAEEGVWRWVNLCVYEVSFAGNCVIQSSPLNGSPDNGSICLLVQV